MNAVVLTGHGGMEKLEYRSDVEVPTPKDDEVLINVKAAGINNTDINTRIGWYSKSSAENSDDGSWSGNPLNFPIIQGADICGIIVGAGKSVELKINFLAEREGFEPSIVLPLYTLSKRAD